MEGFEVARCFYAKPWSLNEQRRNPRARKFSKSRTGQEVLVWGLGIRVAALHETMQGSYLSRDSAEIAASRSPLDRDATPAAMLK